MRKGLLQSVAQMSHQPFSKLRKRQCCRRRLSLLAANELSNTMVNDKAVSLDLARKAGLSTEKFPDQQEFDKVEEVLAKELAHLSLGEKEKVLFGVHGIALSREEDEEMIQKSIQELQKELKSINKKDAYEQALFLNPTYVGSRAFQMLFLRSEDYNAASAAQTMVYHFQLKRELFGDELLAREVLQSDLDEFDTMIMNFGILQLLPARDVGGRFVQVKSCDLQYEGDNPMRTLRSFWYCMMASLRDEELQRNGAVNVVIHFKNMPFKLDYYKFFNRLEIAIPMKILADHYCRPVALDRSTEIGFKLFAGEIGRVRYKFHIGTPEEIKFSLQTYGLPIDSLPHRSDGTWCCKAHQSWLEALRKQEVNDQDAKPIIIPRPKDVLFGKNARARDHPGNVRALNVVEHYFEEYERANKWNKTVVADRIIDLIWQSGGRFLKQQQEGGPWEEVPQTLARQKIAHWCRHMRHKAKNAGPPIAVTDNSKRITPSPSPELLDPFFPDSKMPRMG
eukprot:Nitzschia sp. Nitz4//scaffold83_size84149//41389//42977//NITZ4_005172-RA/size84149-processed-gene-0.57-mRNA-1//-1//CDS//3329558941//1110//frame0